MKSAGKSEEIMREVTLSFFERQDVVKTWEWIQDEEFRADFEMRGKPDWDTHIAYFHSKLKDPSQKVFAIRLGREHIGNCGLKKLDGTSGELWIYIGEEKYRSKGIGKQALDLLLAEVDKLGLGSVYLYVKKKNFRAFSLYIKAHFVPVKMEEEDVKLWGERWDQQCKMSNVRGQGRHYFIIAGSTLQYNFVKEVKAHGFVTHVVDYDPHCRCREVADFFHEISIDEKERILELAKQYDPVAVTTTACEVGNISACWVSERLGLPYSNSYETALNTTHKLRMKNIMAKNTLPTACCIAIHQPEDISGKKFNYPIVIKPADRSAGRGVSIVKNQESLIESFSEALSASHDKTVLIEEVLDGMQYSVETISCCGEHQVVACTEEYLDGTDSCMETQQVVPARLSESELTMLSELVLRTLRAFHIQYGACHVEVKRTTKGFKIIELASRMGAWRDVLVREAYKDNLNAMLLMASLGLRSSAMHLGHKSCIVKLIHHETDFCFYKELQHRNPQVIVDPEIQEYHPNLSHSLADAQGFFYIVTAQKTEIDSYLNNRL